MRAILYARAHASRDEDYPIGELQSYCDGRGWQVVKTFTDRESTRAKSRPVFDEMIAFALGNAVDCLVIHNSARLSRSIVDLQLCRSKLSEGGVSIVATREEQIGGARYSFASPVEELTRAGSCPDGTGTAAAPNTRVSPLQLVIDL